MAPLRWGIASAGKIANDFCMALTTLSSEDHKVVAVAARSVESAKTFAELFSIPKSYGGYENLAKDPEIGENSVFLVILTREGQKLVSNLCFTLIFPRSHAMSEISKGQLEDC